MEDLSCKTPRWRILKTQLNNLSQQAFNDRIMKSDEVIIVDVRTKNEFQHSHILNAINIDYFEEFFWEKLEILDKKKDILIYCRSGRRSIRACLLMKNGGFEAKKIFNLEGGFTQWVINFPNDIK